MLVAGFRVRRFLAQRRLVRDRNQDKQKDEFHGSILPPNTSRSYLIIGMRKKANAGQMGVKTLPLVRSMSTGFC